MLPKMLGGPKEEGGGKGGGLAVVMKFKPRRPVSMLGGPREEDSTEEDDVSGETMSSEQAMKEAAREVISCMSSMKPSPERLSAALEAHTRAVYAMLEDEEGDSEEGNE